MAVKTIAGALDTLNTKLGGTAGEISADSTRVDALKTVYKTLGGGDEVADIPTVSEMIEKLADVAQGGGGSSGGEFTTKEVYCDLSVTSETRTYSFELGFEEPTAFAIFSGQPFNKPPTNYKYITAIISFDGSLQILAVDSNGNYTLPITDSVIPSIENGVFKIEITTDSLVTFDPNITVSEGYKIRGFFTNAPLYEGEPL